MRQIVAVHQCATFSFTDRSDCEICMSTSRASSHGTGRSTTCSNMYYYYNYKIYRLQHEERGENKQMDEFRGKVDLASVCCLVMFDPHSTQRDILCGI